MNKNFENKEKERSDKVTILGIGNAGIKTVDKLSSMKEAFWMNKCALDTDKAALDSCKVTGSFKTLLDEEWRRGKGCGGDVMEGERSISRERNKINELIKNTELLIVTGGLGGGLATGGAPIIARLAKQQKIPTFFIMTTPFTFESHNKIKIAEEGLQELLKDADVAITLPNDLLFSSLPADTPLSDAFRKADLELARAIMGVSEIMRCSDLLATDFSYFFALLNGKKTSSSIGIGTASSSDGLNRAHIAVERMLESSFLGGINRIKSANALYLTVIGGEGMQLGEVKKTLETVSKMAGENAKLIVGANVDPYYEDNIQITAITVHFEEFSSTEMPSRKVAGAQGSSRKLRKDPASRDTADFEQGLLPLQTISKGIFINTTPVFYDGADLDIPSFQRQMVIIDKGQ